MALPEISVVMSVYNGGRVLRDTVDSILSQEGVGFEFIIINDGSQDNSGAILTEYANRDPRVRVFEQQNQGLTKALIRGCHEAKGDCIARQDCGDVSLPGRLAKQIEILRTCPKVMLVSCWATMTGPEKEPLYDVKRADTPEEATQKLRGTNGATLQGVSHHGSTMFRRLDYIKAGGYREQFYFAQDLDLWLRLTERGLLSFVPEVLYQATLGLGDISGKYAQEQRELTRIILQCQMARQAGVPEDNLLEQAAEVRPAPKAADRMRQAQSAYFIGRCLQNRGDARGVNYLKEAVRVNPFHWRAWLFILRARMVK